MMGGNLFAWEGNRAVALSCMAGGIAALASSLAFESGIFSAISAICFVLSIIVWKYGYVLLPAFTTGAKIVEIREGVEIPPSQDIVVKKSSSGYLASVFIGLRLHEGPSSKSDQQKAVMMELFERAISSLRSVTKISIVAANLDLNDQLDTLKAARSLSETRLSQLSLSGQKKAESARLEREIAHYTRQIERLSSGEKPMQIVAYAMTTAEGLTREEACARARAQAREVSAVLSGALGASATLLAGDDLRRCISWEISIPPTQKKLADEMF